MKRRILAAWMLFAGVAHAEPPVVRLAVFTADWCASCTVLGPAITDAMARVDGVERIDLDSSSPQRSAASRRLAELQNLGRVYDAWSGDAGFAALVAADSGEVMGCVTAVFAAPEIEGILLRAIKRVRTLPAGQRALPGRSACPPAAPSVTRNSSAG